MGVDPGLLLACLGVGPQVRSAPGEEKGGHIFAFGRLVELGAGGGRGSRFEGLSVLEFPWVPTPAGF